VPPSVALLETWDAAGVFTSAICPLFHHIQPVYAITDPQPDKYDDVL